MNKNGNRTERQQCKIFLPWSGPTEPNYRDKSAFFLLISFIHSFIPNLVLVVCIVVTEVSNQSDEVGFEADDRRIGGRVSTISKGSKVLSRTENVLTGLPYSMHLLQELCRNNEKQENPKIRGIKKMRKHTFS